MRWKMMRTANPALNANTFRGVSRSGLARAMTIEGTVDKTVGLLFLLVLSAYWAWGRVGQAPGLMILGFMGGFVVAMVTIFKKEWEPLTAPAYALLKGLALGGLSRIFEL